jgi:hypothetical protein
VSFAPDSAHLYASTLLLKTSTDTLSVRLYGIGQSQPVITSDPASYRFRNTQVGQTVLSDPITVVLTNPQNWLTDPGTFSLAVDNGIFRVETVQQGPTLRPDSVYVTLSFTPNAAGVVSDTLIVKALFADDYTIPLTGGGVSAQAQSPQQVTAIAGTEAAAAVVSVKEGNIVVSGAPVGSSVQVYNLAGQSLKTQPVASGAEVLQTASFPRSVYIVVVNNEKQVILRQKVVL